MKLSEYHAIRFPLSHLHMFIETVNADLAAGYLLGGFSTDVMEGELQFTQTLYKESEDDEITAAE